MYDADGAYYPAGCMGTTFGALLGLAVRAAVLYGLAYGIMEVIRWMA